MTVLTYLFTKYVQHTQRDPFLDISKIYNYYTFILTVPRSPETLTDGFSFLLSPPRTLPFDSTALISCLTKLWACLMKHVQSEPVSHYKPDNFTFGCFVSRSSKTVFHQGAHVHTCHGHPGKQEARS